MSEGLVIAFIISQFLPLAIGAVRWLIQMVFHTAVIEHYTWIQNMDHYMSINGWCSSYTFSHIRQPGHGYHMGWCNGGLFIAMKERVNLTNITNEYWYIYALRSATIDALRARIFGDPNMIKVQYINRVDQWSKVRGSGLVVAFAKPRPWQSAAIIPIIEHYDKHKQCTVLICGKPGVGKTTLGRIIASEMRRILKTDATLIQGVDFRSKGIGLDDLIYNLSDSHPSILVVDEFDEAIEHAESKETLRTESRAIADTASGLLSTLDRISETTNLIVIATTNKPLDVFLDPNGCYARYIRDGRFHVKIQVE